MVTVTTAELLAIVRREGCSVRAGARETMVSAAGGGVSAAALCAADALAMAAVVRRRPDDPISWYLLGRLAERANVLPLSAAAGHGARVRASAPEGKRKRRQPWVDRLAELDVEHPDKSTANDLLFREYHQACPAYGQKARNLPQQWAGKCGRWRKSPQYREALRKHS